MECATKFSYAKSSILIGNLYITRNFFCFTGSHQKEGCSVIIKLPDVKDVRVIGDNTSIRQADHSLTTNLQIEEGAVVGFLEQYKGKEIPKIVTTKQKPTTTPNALIVHDVYGNVLQFYSVANTHKTFTTLTSVWRQAVSRASARGQPSQTSTTASTTTEDKLRNSQPANSATVSQSPNVPIRQQGVPRTNTTPSESSQFSSKSTVEPAAPATKATPTAAPVSAPVQSSPTDLQVETPADPEVPLANEPMATGDDGGSDEDSDSEAEPDENPDIQTADTEGEAPAETTDPLPEGQAPELPPRPEPSKPSLSSNVNDGRARPPPNFTPSLPADKKAKKATYVHNKSVIIR